MTASSQNSVTTSKFSSLFMPSVHILYGRHFLWGGGMEWKVTQQGPRAVIEVWRPDQGDGLYKAYLVGQSGRCLLGTLMPEEGRLYLRRTVTVDHLQRQGTWPVKQVEEELVCPFRPSDSPVSWEDPVLRRSARNLPRHTVRREQEGGFSLYFPFDSRAPFPLTPVFCFARLERGQLVFSFEKGGLPYISCRQGENRREANQKEGTGWQI